MSDEITKSASGNVNEAEGKFTKAQLVKSKRFENHRDILKSCVYCGGKFIFNGRLWQPPL